MIDNPRGFNKIYKALFVTETDKEKYTKGRSPKCILRRNECLCDRYLYYGRISGKRFDLLLKDLSIEFFLTETTIADLLDANYTYVLPTKKKYHELSETTLKKKLKSKWPHLSW